MYRVWEDERRVSFVMQLPDTLNTEVKGGDGG